MKTKSEIIYFDDHLIIVDKSAGVTTVADRTGKSDSYLLKWLHSQFDEVYPVHRLDTNTSGLVAFARHLDEQRRLSQIFEERLVIKKYKALVIGIPSPANGTINKPILRLPNKNQVVISNNGKESVTHYEILETFKSFSLLDVTPSTGRTHQIRVHLQHIGHPLLVDPLYGGQEAFYLSSVKYNFRGRKDEERPLLQRTPLHAYFLSFPDQKGMKLSFESALPKDIAAVLKQLSKL
ncbi:MAG: RluA family pseudouridine synthase [Saprospiraceae bacterium]|nr:RluA family pseudouridine synthase [Saprospiraceae bacterium]